MVGYSVVLTEAEKEQVLELIHKRTIFLMGKCDVELPFSELMSLIEIKYKLEGSVKSYL